MFFFKMLFFQKCYLLKKGLFQSNHIEITDDHSTIPKISKQDISKTESALNSFLKIMMA